MADGVRVVITGATGKVARELLAGLPRAEGITVVGAVSRSASSEALPLPSGGSVPLARELGPLLAAVKADVIVDFTNAEYAVQSARKAQQSLADLGWIGWQPDGRVLSFTEAFAYLTAIKEPRGVQAEVIAAAKEPPSPRWRYWKPPRALARRKQPFTWLTAGCNNIAVGGFTSLCPPRRPATRCTAASVNFCTIATRT